MVVVVCEIMGSGKTRILNRLAAHGAIDLEGLAHRWGSAFENLPESTQPSQIDIKNGVIVGLIRALDLLSPSAVPWPHPGRG